MRNVKVFYWIFTGLFAAQMLFASIPDILNTPDAVKFMSDHLGYPHYFTPFIGVLKFLGVIAILIPGYPRIKEWAYAGFAYDLIGATYSLIAIGETVNHWAPMLIFIAIGACSYIFYRKKQHSVEMTPVQ